ncbi:BMC domain-containing protein [Chachezhania sediminis]|uniref:BMC domain-containing protein n=1 Tax=Chachezhania sediminis TaxID=2599291 RepID=UPI00131CB393|nr:BMC domain-containing protein [Chachezhania sediminis]
MANLRSYIFLDQLQPQTMCLLGANMRGFLPRANDAALIVEVAPGMDIEWITDVALKHENVKPGNLVVERQFGYLEFHSPFSSSVKSAGAEILDSIGASASDAIRPEILSSRVVDRVDNLHSFLINRTKTGSMLLPSESLFILETQPAAYALLAVNEAEKAADVKLVECRFMGAAGRIYLSGEASSVRAAQDAAERALQMVEGRAV